MRKWDTWVKHPEKEDYINLTAATYFSFSGYECYFRVGGQNYTWEMDQMDSVNKFRASVMRNLGETG